MQNGLKRMFFMKEKKFGSRGKISIFYENIGKMSKCSLFKKEIFLVAARGVDPPPRLRTGL